MINSLDDCKKKLEQENIKYLFSDDVISAKLDKRDEEGHSQLRLIISKNKDDKITGEVHSIGRNEYDLSPEDAIISFVSWRLLFFV